MAGEIERATDRMTVREGTTPTVKTLQELRARLVTRSGAYPQPMLIDQLSSIARMAGSADQKVGRSAFEYLGELKHDLARIQAEFAALGMR